VEGTEHDWEQEINSKGILVISENWDCIFGKKIKNKNKK